MSIIESQPQSAYYRDNSEITPVTPILEPVFLSLRIEESMCHFIETTLILVHKHKQKVKET